MITAFGIALQFLDPPHPAHKPLCCSCGAASELPPHPAPPPPCRQLSSCLPWEEAVSPAETSDALVASVFLGNPPFKWEHR